MPSVSDSRGRRPEERRTDVKYRSPQIAPPEAKNRTATFSEFSRLSICRSHIQMTNQVGTIRIACGSIPVRVMGRILLLAGVVCLSTMGKLEAQENAAAAALAQLRGLA